MHHIKRRPFVKIKRVLGNNRKRAFLLDTSKGHYEFPYSQLKLKPSKRDPLAHVAPDGNFGNQAFSYQLRSGAADTVHIDHVLRYAEDTDYLREELVFKLTVEANRLMEKRRLTKKRGCATLKHLTRSIVPPIGHNLLRKDR